MEPDSHLIRRLKKRFLQYLAWMLVITAFFPVGVYIDAQSTAKYDQQKQRIESQKSKIQGELQSANNDLHNARQLSGSLSGEIRRKEGEMQRADQLINEVNTLIKELDGEIISNEKRLEDLVEEMKRLIIEIQKESQNSPLESILSSQNLSEALTRVYNLSVLQDKANSLRSDIEKTNSELQQNKLDQEDALLTLQESKALLASQKSTLEDLLVRTENDEAKYQALRSNLIAQQETLEQQLSKVEADKRSEIEAERQRQAAQSRQNQRSARNNFNTDTNCWFETRDRLDVPAGFFGKPTNGFVSQPFWCGHDAVDIANSLNTQLLAIADGTIAARGSYDVFGYGNYIVLKVNTPSGKTVYALYAHLNSFGNKRVGDSVKKGDVIGFMGCTGLCFGVHVHFMMYTDSFESGGVGCRLGSSKCYNPLKYINPIS